MIWSKAVTDDDDNVSIPDNDDNDNDDDDNDDDDYDDDDYDNGDDDNDDDDNGDDDDDDDYVDDDEGRRAGATPLGGKLVTGGRLQVGKGGEKQERRFKKKGCGT